MIITLDGPSGSGKSTLAQVLAQKLGFFYMNSGYLYRSLAYLLVHEFNYDELHLECPDIEHVKMILDENNFFYVHKDGVAQVFFREQEITHHLKSTVVSHHASIISAHAQVRQLIVPLQQKFGNMYNLVTDGRDGGTEIYPHAQFKFYVTASPEIRAERLQADLAKKGVQMTLQETLNMTVDRDERDMTRTISPLKKAHDAIEVDTSYLSIDELVAAMLLIIQK